MTIVYLIILYVSERSPCCFVTSGIPEQTLVTFTLDTGVPLSSEALCGQLELQGKSLHILTVQAGSLQLFT